MGQFQKGQSGNPRGRSPRVVEDRKREQLAILFDEKAEAAVIKNMIAIAKGKTAAAVQAATWLDERKHGKLVDRLKHQGETTIHVIYEGDEEEEGEE